MQKNTQNNSQNNTQNIQKKSIKFLPLLMALCIAQSSLPLQAEKNNNGSIVGGLLAGARALACIVGGSILGYNYKYNDAKSCINEANKEEQDSRIKFATILPIYQNNIEHRFRIIKVIEAIKKESVNISYTGNRTSDHFPLLWYTHNLEGAINRLQTIYNKLVSYRSAMQEDLNYYKNIAADRYNAEITLNQLLQTMNAAYSDIIATHEYQQEKTDYQRQEENRTIEQFRVLLNEHQRAFDNIDNQLSQLRSIYDVSDFIRYLSDIITYQFTRITIYPAVYNSTIRNYYPRLWYEDQLQETALKIQLLCNSLQNAHAKVAGLYYYAAQTQVETSYRYLIDRMNTVTTILNVTQNRLRVSPLYIADLYAYENACAYAEQQVRLDHQRHEELERIERLERLERERAREWERERERETKKEQERERERIRQQERELEQIRAQERERARDREREKERAREIAKERELERAREIERARDRAKEEERQKQEKKEADAQFAKDIAKTNNARIAEYERLKAQRERQK